MVIIAGIILFSSLPFFFLFLPLAAPSATIFELVVYLIAGLSVIEYNNGMKKTEQDVKDFRGKQNFCYSCGADIKQSITAKICPYCNSNLDFEEILL